MSKEFTDHSSPKELASHEVPKALAWGVGSVAWTIGFIGLSLSKNEAIAEQTQIVNELHDLAGYEPLLGDMNGPDQYDIPLAEATERLDEQLETKAELLVIGLLGIGIGGPITVSKVEDTTKRP